MDAQNNEKFSAKLGVAGCSDCLCRTCLYWWSGRCPYGECYDEKRAADDPYDKAHPNEPPRTAWSNWKTDQAYWCRGGVFYAQNICKHYKHYEGSAIQGCFGANVQIFQDGHVSCSIIDSVGCAACFEHFNKHRQEKKLTAHSRVSHVPHSG